MFQYDGRSLVPDLTNSLNLALGIGEQIKQKKQGQQVASLSGQYLDARKPGAGTTEESQRILARLAQVDPQAAQTMMMLAQNGDDQAASEMAAEASVMKSFYQGLTALEDEEQIKLEIQKMARSRAGEGKNIDPLVGLIQLSGDELRNGVLSKAVMAGDVEAFSRMQGEQFTLSKDQVRFDDAGRVVASNQGSEQEDRKTAKDLNGVLRYVDDNSAVFAQDEQKLADDQAAAEAQKAQELAALEDQAKIVQTEIGRAISLLPDTSSGRVGEALSTARPSGKNAELRRTIETIKANIGFDKLMEMKRNSPTGGALGNVSEKELAGLQAVLGNLDATASDADLERSLRQVQSFYNKLYSAPSEGEHISSGGVRFRVR